MEENLFWFRLWSLLLGFALIMLSEVAIFTYLGKKDMIRAGFTRDVLPGYAGVQWIKRPEPAPVVEMTAP